MGTTNFRQIAFAESLERLMKARGFSDRGLAKAMTDRGLDVSRDKIGAWKKGKRYPDLVEADMLSSLLDTGLLSLAYGSESQEPESVNDEAFVLRTVRALGLDADEAVRRLYAESPLPPPRGVAVRDLSESTSQRIDEEKKSIPRGKRPGPSAPPASKASGPARKKASN
jgi:transcriptional regulator with XRE-family HTH domain